MAKVLPTLPYQSSIIARLPPKDWVTLQGRRRRCGRYTSPSVTTTGTLPRGPCQDAAVASDGGASSCIQLRTAAQSLGEFSQAMLPPGSPGPFGKQEQQERTVKRQDRNRTHISSKLPMRLPPHLLLEIWYTL